MNKFKENLLNIQNLKKDFGLEIIDTHIHPTDVMGVVHFDEIVDECRHENYSKPGILERFKYGPIEKIGSRIFFKLFPSQVDKIIRNTYGSVNSQRIEEEMEVSLTDKAVLLSLDPWAPTEKVYRKFSSEDFMILGSIDIHSIDKENIGPLIHKYVAEYGIIGLKLHPNLQNFHPQPCENNEEICEKLRIIYRLAEQYKIYLLFHGGISNYTKEINGKYGFHQRSRIYGKIENFLYTKGRNELLNLNVPIVIAHIGHYGLANVDYESIKKIGYQHDNLFFDTSGVSPKVISNSLRILPSKKFIFGSDALYNRIAFNASFLYEAAEECHNGEDLTDILLNIFGKNFRNFLIK